MIDKVDHVGIAVHDLEEAARFYNEALGVEASEPERVPSEGVRIVFLSGGDRLIELLEPLDEGSPIQKFLERRGEGMHHICFRVDDIEEAMRQMASSGAQLIDDEPRDRRDGTRLAFVHPSSAHGVLIELLEVEEIENIAEVEDA